MEVDGGARLKAIVYGIHQACALYSEHSDSLEFLMTIVF